MGHVRKKTLRAKNLHKDDGEHACPVCFRIPASFLQLGDRDDYVLSKKSVSTCTT